MWLLSLDAGLKFIHLAMCAGGHSFAFSMASSAVVIIYHILNKSSLDRHVAGFHLITTNCPTQINILIQVFYQHVFILLGKNLQVEFLVTGWVFIHEKVRSSFSEEVPYFQPCTRYSVLS